MDESHAAGPFGAAAPRLDGVAKVTGAARYAADFPVQRPAFACLVTSGIAKGRVAGFDLEAARAVPGCLLILTHEDVGSALQPIDFFASGGPGATSRVPLGSAEVAHDGDIVGLVVAETFEAAREAAYKVGVRYEAEPPAGTLGAAGTETAAIDDLGLGQDPATGDAEGALAAAAVTVEGEYVTPAQHHNAIELYATTCAWEGDRLTIFEPSQWVYALKNGVAKQLGIEPSLVHVVSPYVGGAFGSKGTVTQRTAIVALAARRLGRPVKLVATRDQGFTIATYRAETRHRVRLGADADGRLTAYAHEAWELTSRADPYFNAGTKTTTAMYAAPNIATRVYLVRADRNTPGFMRSPPEVPYMYALESAMDELAVALRMDPVELRRRNDTMTSPINGARYTSRSLMECYDRAAAAFGWAKREPAPGSMRDGDWLIGWGCATACYPTQMSPTAARVRVAPDGGVTVEVAAHDVGTGAYTVIGQTAADRLGVPLDRVRVELGDSDLPVGPVAGGSVTTASVCSAVAEACDRLRPRLGGEGGEEYVEWYPLGTKQGAVKQMYEGGIAMAGGPMDDRVMFAFGAEFVEVRVHARTREVRVPRITGAFAAGRIVNPRTARSQYLGGLIWGISSALHEATEIDEDHARYVNDNIAEYLIPVNADIGEVEIIMVPEEDHEVNPLGVKGIGELANVGTAAAIANAVFHATGVRIRELPIRIEKLL